MPKQVVEREFRSALVFYGGVSLAIYENGVARAFYDSVRGRGVFGPLLGALRTRHVVDVISGSSAGGINGLLLATALETGAEFAETANLWREHGGLEELLRPVSGAHRARSLLDGEVYYFDRLREAFRDMVTKRRPDHTPPREMDIYVTGTDLTGQFWDFSDALGSQVTTKDHSLVFHLKHRGTRKRLGHTPDSPEDAKGSLLQGEILASVARITSSFPGAFRPFTVDAFNHPATGPKPRPACDPAVPDQVRQALSHLSRAELGPSGPSTTDHELIDGGVLDNKPFGPVLRAIFHRSPSPRGEMVDRRVFYIEPDPVTFSRDSRESTPLQVAVNSVTTLPAYDSIAADVRAIHGHNRQVAVIQSLRARASERGAKREGQPAANTAAYLDALAQSVAAYLLGADPTEVDPPENLAPVTAFVVRRTREGTSLEGAVKRLQQLDLGLPLRRLFNLLYAEGDDGQSLLAPHQRAALARALKAFKLLRDVWLADPAPKPGASPESRLERLERYVDGHWFPVELSSREDAELSTKDWFRIKLGPDALGQYVRSAKAWLKTGPRSESPLNPIERIGDRITELLGKGAPPGRVWSNFLALDSQIYPSELAAGVYELDHVELIRVSPHDARIPAIAGPDKITGDKLGHFSAFLRRDWRSNDIAWGHCDGICQVIGALFHEKSWNTLAEPLTQPAAASRPLAGLSSTSLMKIYEREWTDREQDEWDVPNMLESLRPALGRLDAARVAFEASPSDSAVRARFRDAVITVAQTAAAAEYIHQVASDKTVQDVALGWRARPIRKPPPGGDPLETLTTWKIGAEELGDALPRFTALEYATHAGLLLWGMVGTSLKAPGAAATGKVVRKAAKRIHAGLDPYVRRLLEALYRTARLWRRGWPLAAIALLALFGAGIGYAAVGIWTERPARIGVGLGGTLVLSAVVYFVANRRWLGLATTLVVPATLLWGWHFGGIPGWLARELRQAANELDGPQAARNPPETNDDLTPRAAGVAPTRR